MPFGHKHDEAEEIYVVIAGSGRIKLDDEIIEVVELDAIRISPEVARGFEAGAEGIEVLAFGAHHDGDGEADAGLVDRLMAPVEVDGVEGMRALRRPGDRPERVAHRHPGDIDAFAELSGDHQWIHVDAERAKTESPFGTTIAHGNLTLSLVDGFRNELMYADRLRPRRQLRLEQDPLPGPGPGRLPRPRPRRARLLRRARRRLVAGGDPFTIEVEGSEKPCFVGESVTRLMAPAEPEERGRAAASTSHRRPASATGMAIGFDGRAGDRARRDGARGGRPHERRVARRRGPWPTHGGGSGLARRGRAPVSADR